MKEMDLSMYKNHSILQTLSSLFPYLIGVYIIFIPQFTFAGNSNPFCQAIQSIMESGKTQFKSIRGQLDLVSEEYFGTLTPPDLQDCFGWLDGKAYHCKSKDGMNEMEVGEAYDTFKTKIRNCLSGDWTEKERDMKRANARRLITYTSSEHPVRIKVAERSKRRGWFVDFYFNR